MTGGTAWCISLISLLTVERYGIQYLMALVDACQVEGVLGIKGRVDEEARTKLERLLAILKWSQGPFLSLRTTSIAREALKHITPQTFHLCDGSLQLLGV